MNTAEEIEEQPNLLGYMAAQGTYYRGPVVVFGLPGAFTPTCTKSQLPKYEELYHEFEELGYGLICISVNDHYVMEAWFEKLGIEDVEYYADGNGDFTRYMGMMVSKNNKHMGERSWRYAVVTDEDGYVEKWFVEEGKMDEAELDPYEETKPEKILEYLRSK